MTAFAETLKIVWREQAIPILKVMTASDNNLINGKICSHTPIFTSKKLTAYEIMKFLYIDDGTFLFGSREDLKHGMELIFHHFGGESYNGIVCYCCSIYCNAASQETCNDWACGT